MKFMPRVQTFLGTAVLFLAIVFATKIAHAQNVEPSGKISMETTSFAFGVGMSWGNGKLVFHGKEFRFSIDGVTFMDFGIGKASAAGVVYNLTDLASFEGNYVATEASFALGGGVGSLSLRNQNGVVMSLSSVSQGARLQLGASGMSISLW